MNADGTIYRFLGNGDKVLPPVPGLLPAYFWRMKSMTISPGSRLR